MPNINFSEEGTTTSATNLNNSLTLIAAETGDVGSDNIRTGTLGREHLTSPTAFTVVKYSSSKENTAASAAYTGTPYQLIAHGTGMTINTVGLVLNQGDVLRLQASILMKSFVIDQASTDECKYRFQFWWTYDDGMGPVTSPVELFTYTNGYLIRDDIGAGTKSAFKNIRRGFSYLYLHASSTARTVSNIQVRVSLANDPDSVTLQHFNFIIVAYSH